MSVCDDDVMNPPGRTKRAEASGDETEKSRNTKLRGLIQKHGREIT